MCLIIFRLQNYKTFFEKNSEKVLFLIKNCVHDLQKTNL